MGAFSGTLCELQRLNSGFFWGIIQCLGTNRGPRVWLYYLINLIFETLWDLLGPEGNFLGPMLSNCWYQCRKPLKTSKMPITGKEPLKLKKLLSTFLFSCPCSTCAELLTVAQLVTQTKGKCISVVQWLRYLELATMDAATHGRAVL